MTRNQFTNLLLLNPLYLRLLVWLSKPFMSLPKVYNYITPKEVWLSYYRALKPGDIAVQAGVAMRVKKDSTAWYDNSSYLWAIANRVGRNGRVIIIEPDPQNIEKLEKVVADSPFDCQFTIVQKALFRRKAQAKFHIGHRTSWNRIEGVQDKNEWTLEENCFTGRTIDVELDTLDNILAEQDLCAKDISFVCLTINGAEYDALIGMQDILKDSQDLSIAVIAGREIGSPNKTDDIGYIDEKPDHEVITKFVDSFGFSSHLRRFKLHSYGFVVCTKGNRKAFL